MPLPRRVQSRWPGLAAAAIAAAVAFTAGGQTPSVDEPDSGRWASEVRAIAGEALARACLVRLRSTPEPLPIDYRLAARTLRIIQRILPEDEELLRLELHAWSAAGEDDLALDAVERILKRDPRDTVLQLRVLTSRLRRLQDAQQRLAAYDRLLGPQGQALDASIRSRLALDSALLARETGDEEGFVERLTHATTLDPTNKDAAALYSTYFLDRVSNPLERAELLALVILADPNDNSAHSNLAGELLRQGAYAGAKRFLDRAADIARSAKVEPAVADLFDRYLVKWMVEGDNAVLSDVMALQNLALAAIRHQRKVLERQGTDPGEEPTPTIPSEIEIIRLAVHWASGDAAGVAASAKRISQRLQDQLVAMARRDPPYENTTSEQEATYKVDAAHQTLSARLWSAAFVPQSSATRSGDFGALTVRLLEARESASLAGDLESLKLVTRAGRLSAQAQARFEGLLALRAGDCARARQRLTDAGNDPMARLALGMLAEREGDRRGAIRAYAALALDMPHRLVGCAARKRIEHLLGHALEPTPTVRALEDWARRFAPWLDEMTRNPTKFMTLTADHTHSRIDCFGEVDIRVSLRNVSRVPMSIGPDLAFSSRLLLTPRFVVRGQDASTLVEPMVVEFDRRLRLMPGEAVETVVRGSRGSLGVWLDRFADKTVTIRWRVIQGYRIDADRRFTPGPISVAAMTGILIREAISERTSIEEVASTLAHAQGRAFLEEVLRAVGLGGTQAPNEPPNAVETRRALLANALAQRVPSLSEFEKVHVVSTTGRIGLPAKSGPLLDSLRDDPSPFVQAALILDAYRNADDPGLLRLVEHDDIDLRDMAIALRQRLALGAAPVESLPTEVVPPDEAAAAQEIQNREENPPP